MKKDKGMALVGTLIIVSVITIFMSASIISQMSRLKNSRKVMIELQKKVDLFNAKTIEQNP
jgi:type II secretory pathway component PulK